MSTLMNTFMKERSFENYSNEAALEFMLSTAGVHGNVPVMITNMLDTFGSFKGILEARPEQLLHVPGVTRKAAALISAIVPMVRVWERCNAAEPDHITNAREAESFCKSLLMGERTERFYAIALNARCRILGYRKISEGTLSEVSAYPRSVLETALNFNAHSVLLAHNHPGGTCAPSPEDLASTSQLQRILGSVGILVLDHVIVAGSQSYSMIQHGDIDFRRR